MVKYRYKKTLKKLANFRLKFPDDTRDDDTIIEEMQRLKANKGQARHDATPEAKAKRAKWRATPEAKAKRAKWRATPEAKAARNAKWRAARRRDRGACHAAGIPYELDKRFYVYGYYLAGATLPIYIGKGVGNRDRRHLTLSQLKRLDPFHTELRRLKKLGIEVEIIRLFKELSEQEALAKEEALIEHFGIRPEGILYNSRANGSPGAGAGGGKQYWCQGKKLTIAQMVLLPGCELTEGGLYGRLEISDKYETVEDAVFSQLVIGRQGKEYLFFGEMKTIPAIADDSRCKVSSGTIYAREKKGDFASIQEAATTVLTKRGRPAKEYLFFGKKKTIQAILDDPRCVVCKTTLNRRRASGDYESVSAAATTLPKTRRKQELTTV